MMQKYELKSSAAGQINRFGPISSDTTPELSAEDKSKDVYFVQLARLTEAMVAEHGKDFAMGTLVLSARFIAEGKPLIKKEDGNKENATTPHIHGKNCGC